MNKVHLTGKISRVGQLAYSPSGLALLEFTMAVSQEAYSKTSMGYFQLVASGDKAEELKGKLKIGIIVTAEGQLFHRAYTNKFGVKVEEVKVILENLEEKNEKIRK